MSKETKQFILVVIILLAAFGVVGSMDYDDAKKAEAEYCKWVDAGYPDYQKKYDALCVDK